jgi:3-methyladenine DNA glycosylase AlkD
MTRQETSDTTVTGIVERLKTKARPDQLEGMARYGIVGEQRLGVVIPDLRSMAKELGKNHPLAIKLWKTSIADAKILAAMIDDPTKLSEVQMENWVKDIDSWDICDQVCMNLFEKTPLAWKKIVEWSKREDEFTRRAAFALIACLAWHDKGADDEKFTRLLPVIKRGATDDRNLVKKSVSWALRNIGKRNLTLNKAAIDLAREVQRIDSKAARWIASDAITELESRAVQSRLRKRDKAS